MLSGVPYILYMVCVLLLKTTRTKITLTYYGDPSRIVGQFSFAERKQGYEFTRDFEVRIISIILLSAEAIVEIERHV